MKKTWIIVGVIAAVVIAGIAWYINGLNTVVRLDVSADEAWAQIDTQLKRRTDLIPNLVNVVKGYAKHEKSVFENVAASRARLAGASTVSEKIDAAKSFDNAIARLLMVAENYPALKANESFAKLMDELAGTENRIAVARYRYNREVKAFNTYIREVFGSFFARKKGLTETKPYFEIEEKEKATPRVEF